MKRLVSTSILWAGISFLAGLMLILAGPRLLGGQSMAVLSGSMAPAIDTGDEVIVLPEPAERIKPGEVAVFEDPEGSGRLLNHRVQSLVERDGRVYVVTLGDANQAPERWSVPAGGEVGKVVARIPEAGYLIGRLDSRSVLLATVVIPAILLGLWLLISIWRAPENPLPSASGK